MSAWIEERLEAIRLALRIPGFPVEADLYRLVDWLGGNVLLRYERVGVPMRILRPDGGSLINLPERLRDRHLDEALCHELAHVLLTGGMGCLLRQLPVHPDRAARLERLARVCDAQDEARAREFVAAWALPSALVAAYPDDSELAWSANCTEELVRRRRHALRGTVVRLETPPRWCASLHYRVVHQAGVTPLLYLVARGEEAPRYSFPVRPGAGEEAAVQLAADLIALTPDELERKYEPFRCAPAEPLELSLDALRERLGSVS
jgi:hypothetical protein